MIVSKKVGICALMSEARQLARTSGAPTHCNLPRPECSERMPIQCLVDLLHLGALVVVIFEGRQLVNVISLVVVLNGKAQFDHAVDARGESSRLFERKAGGKKRGLEEQVHEILDCLVALVSSGLGLKLLHDRVLGV